MSSFFRRLPRLGSMLSSMGKPPRRGMSSSIVPSESGGADTKIPKMPLALGFAGLIPFLGGTYVVVEGGKYRDLAVQLQRGYGAVILSFLGAVHWGLALRSKGPVWPMYTFAVTPSLIGWLSTFVPTLVSYPMLAVAFATVHIMEIRTLPKLKVAPWYLRLRLPLNIFATLSLIVTYNYIKKDEKYVKEFEEYDPLFEGEQEPSKKEADIAGDDDE